MTIYTIIAYKPSGYDTRHQEYFQSELDCPQIFEDAESAANQIVRYKIQNEEDNAWYQDWEYQIFIDGRDWDYWNVDFGGTGANNPFQEVHDLVSIKFDEWISKGKEREEAAKREAEIKEQREKVEKAERVIREEKALLATLKARYESDNGK